MIRSEVFGCICGRYVFLLLSVELKAVKESLALFCFRLLFFLAST